MATTLKDLLVAARAQVPDITPADAAKLMSEHQIRRLPIINAEKRLVGIVALGDLAVDRADFRVAGEALSEISKPS